MDAENEEELSDHEDVDEMFRSEVRQALGSAAVPGEESDDVEDLDDEAMMKLDPMLSDIFKKKKVLLLVLHRRKILNLHWFIFPVIYHTLQNTNVKQN